MECSICQRQFSRRNNLLKHARNFHGLPHASTGMFRCLEEENCQSFRYCYQLISHLESCHGLEVTRNQLNFVDFSDFQNWLENLELKENVKFSRHTGKIYNESTHTRKTSYQCSRTGKQRLISKDQRKYALRRKGSCKLNFGCTSQITVKEDTISKNCEVVYISSHYGHSLILTRDIEVKQVNSDDDQNLNVMNILDNLGAEPRYSKKMCTEEWQKRMKAETKSINESIDTMDLSDEKQSMYLMSLKTFATQLKLELQISDQQNERTFTNIDHFVNNSKIKKQGSFFSTRKKSNKKKGPKKTSRFDEKIIRETLSGSLFISDSAEHDHSYIN